MYNVFETIDSISKPPVEKVYLPLNLTLGLEVGGYQSGAVSNPPVASGTFVPPAGIDGTAYSYDTSVLFTGGAVVTYSVATGTLPSGLSLNTSSGLISGTPDTVETEVGISITGTNADGADTTNTASIAIAISAPIASGTFAPPAGTVNAAYSYATSTLFTGGTVSYYSLNGTLPTGLSLNTSSGLISGTPTTEQTLTNISVTGTNATDSDTTNTANITISAVTLPAPVFLGVAYLPDGYNNTAYSFDASPFFSGEVDSYTLLGTWPSGAAIDSSGVITFTPTTVNSYSNVSIRASNVTGNDITHALNLEIKVEEVVYAIRSAAGWASMTAGEQAEYAGTYETLALFYAAVPDLVTADVCWVAECFNDFTVNTWSGSIGGKTTDATRRVIFRASNNNGLNGRSRANGSKSVGYEFKFDWSTSVGAVDLTFDGIIVTCNNEDLFSAGTGFNSDHKTEFLNCTLYRNGVANALVWRQYISFRAKADFINNVIYGYIQEQVTSGRFNFYNNVFVGATSALDINIDTPKYAYNNVFLDYGSESVRAFTGASNNATSNASATNIGADALVGIVSGDFEDEPNDDYHIPLVSALRDKGLNLVLEGDMLNPSYDGDGDLYPYLYKWNIGSDIDANNQTPATLPPNGIPAISVAPSNISHGDSVTVTGVNFGTNPSVAPEIWDDFESGTNGADIAAPWTAYLTPTNSPDYTNAGAYSGSLSVMNTVSDAGGGFNTAWQEFTLSDETYLAYRFKFSTSGSDYGIMKLARVTSDYDGADIYTPHYNGPGDFTLQYQPQSSWLYATWNKGGESEQRTLNYNLPEDQWIKVEMYKKLSTPGQNDGRIIVRVNDEAYVDEDNIVTRDSGYTFQNESVLLPLMFANAQAGAVIDMYVDDAYLANTLSRVEIANCTSDSGCGDRVIQIPQTWADGSIGFEVNLGDLDTTGDLYLFVTDSNGVTSSSALVTTA